MRPLPFFIISCFVLIQSFQEKASGQIYHIESSNGKLVKIRLRYEPYNGSLIISSSRDTLILPNLLDTFEVSHLSKRFLDIKYTIDGGTGILATRTVIISVQKGKQIIPSLIFESGLSILFDHTKRFRTVSSRLSNQDSDSCELSLILRDKQISPHHIMPNFDSSNHIILKYDRHLGIFCGGEKRLSHAFTVINEMDNGKSQKHLTGKFPTFKIGSDQYYYIANLWYNRIDSNQLVQLAEKGWQR